MAHSTSGITPTHPSLYVIGTQRTQVPLVSPRHIKGHLRLLRAFYNLRVTVEDCKDRRIPRYAMKLDKNARWRWFVHLAVERFELWVKSLQFVPLEKFVTQHVPPLDVWMLWHAYMLSPCWYAEDCERLELLRQLKLLNMFVVGSIDVGKVVRREPCDARVEAWFKQTGLPFNPFDAMTATESEFKRVECPRCRTMAHVPFVNGDGTGFAEGDFSVACPLPGCRLKITHDGLAVAKFVRDLSQGGGAQERFVAGSLFSPSGKRDPNHAKVIKDQLLQSIYFSGLVFSATDERLARLDRVKEVKENLGYSLEHLKEIITTSLENHPAASVSRVLSAYTNGSLFSVDLVDAVLRQCHFTDQMNDLGWLKSSAFREADKREILEHSVMRYHGFLDLVTAFPNAILVPTLDIDLVWHTHQLMPSRYGVDCEIYVGRYVDHELSVSENRLSSAFDDTCRAWQARFHVSYTQCGCPVPDAGISAHKLIRLFRSYLSGRSQPQVALHPEHLPATHPSTHNALLTFQTVCTGTFVNMHRVNGKRREERSQSPVHRERTACQRPQYPTQLDLDLMPPMRRSPSMPMYSARVLPALPKTFSLW